MNSSGPTSEILRARIAAAQGNGSAEPAAASPSGAASESHISVIGADILVTGNIEAEVDLHIEGRVQGDVRCATLILGEHSSVTGSIYAQRVRVSGTVEGAIETTDLAIEAGAHVKGDVTYSRLRIANGAIMEGKLIFEPLDEEGGQPAKVAIVDDEPAPSKKGPKKVHYIE